ncbi:hypothetical protein DTO063F5_6175 [Paecilomyces variotii]|nr:hypothetical protein DTO063F5_6175 [Paecilomyces variotii]
MANLVWFFNIHEGWFCRQLAQLCICVRQLVTTTAFAGYISNVHPPLLFLQYLREIILRPSSASCVYISSPESCLADKIVAEELGAAAAVLAVVEMAAEAEAAVYSHPENYRYAQQTVRNEVVAGAALGVTPEEEATLEDEATPEEEVTLEGEKEPAPIVVFSPEGGIPPPDAKVKDVEETIEKTLSKKSPGQRKTELPERPGFGTRGRPVQLLANYFRLSAQQKGTLSRYNLQILPNAGRAPSGRKSKQIIKLLLDQHFSDHKNKIATDYKAMLVSARDIGVQAQEYSVQYRPEAEEDVEPMNPQIYQVLVQKTGEFSTSDLLEYLSSTDANAVFPAKEEVIQVLNVVVGHWPKSNAELATIGANKHIGISQALIEKGPLIAGLEVLRGFFVSVRPATSRLVLNVQVKNIACYQSGPLVNLLREFGEDCQWNPFKIGSFVRLLRVETTHIVKKNKQGQRIPRVKVVAGIARKTRDGPNNRVRVKKDGAGPRDVSFLLEESGQGQGPSGKWITVEQFFRDRYNIQTDANIPVVNVGTPNDPKYLPAEVCQVIPGQPSKAKLTPEQTRGMINFAVRKPAENAKSIVTKGASVLGVTPRMNETLTAFGLNVDPSLIAVPGRVLTCPQIHYGDVVAAYKDSRGGSGGKKKQHEIQDASAKFGSWNMNKIRFSRGASVGSWAWLHIQKPRSRTDALSTALGGFLETMQVSGITVNEAVASKNIVINWKDVEGQIGTAIDELMRHRPEMILFILDVADAPVYNCIKKNCDRRVGVRNVCVLAHKFMGKFGRDVQYFANVALKVNLKFGGVNQSLWPDKLGIISEGKTMVVGIDVTHPSPGSRSNAPSVAGIVASIDSSLAQWPADIRVQTGRVESVEHLRDMLKSRLRLWAQHNNKQYPENILVYRDGVSEGQYQIVNNEEKNAMKKACEELYPATLTKKGLPRLTIVIVGKRHHTRFYPTKENEADRSSNPQNGTIVDRGVTEARNWDFFLQAHTALQGTARPAHYYIVYDEIFRGLPLRGFSNTADILEDLTHNMCYLFGRATKAVSICPPAYYADLLCERARCYLSDIFDAASDTASTVSGATAQAQPGDISIHDNVKNTMFYI